MSTNKFEPEKIVEKRNDQNLFQASYTAEKYGDITPLLMTKKTAHQSIRLLDFHKSRGIDQIKVFESKS